MVFVDPVLHALYHKPAHHGLFAGGLVATAGAIGITSIIVIRIGALEVRVVDVVGMVIYHIENHGDACLMKGLYHLLELTDTAERIVGVGAIATLRHVIVYRVVAPVVLGLVEACLIHGTIVVAGQDMYGIDAQLLQVLDSP